MMSSLHLDAIILLEPLWASAWPKGVTPPLQKLRPFTISDSAEETSEPTEKSALIVNN